MLAPLRREAFGRSFVIPVAVGSSGLLRFATYVLQLLPCVPRGIDSRAEINDERARGLDDLACSNDSRAEINDERARGIDSRAVINDDRAY